MSHLSPKQPSPELWDQIKRLRIDAVQGLVYGAQGKSIGFKDVHGHIIITVYIKSKGYKIRRPHLIWWKHHNKWPEDLIDHRNRIKDDDRIDNLRCRSHHENMVNKVDPTRNLLVGVYHSETNPGMFECLIKTMFVGRSYGPFTTQEEANEKYLQVVSALREAIKNVE